MRLFAFSGPSLPLDRHFAVGNFVRDAVGSSLIQVRSDGTSVRSYLDERDLADWISHVGSERAISIGELAHLVASRTETITGSPCNVKILGKSSPVDGVARYVPNTARTRECLGVKETISLEQSIDDMINTHLAR
jgi:dTDP-glucose 4,6-dehydratase